MVPRATSLTTSPVLPSFLNFTFHAPSVENQNCDGESPRGTIYSSAASVQQARPEFDAMEARSAASLMDGCRDARSVVRSLKHLAVRKRKVGDPLAVV